MSQTKTPIFIITAPSGAGKTTIARFLLNTFPMLCFSVSTTTRKPRKGEIDGKDYHFVSRAEFEKGVEENIFAEWEMVYEGLYYGTPKAELQRIWDSGKVPLLDIDVHGAIKIQKLYEDSCLSIYIQPPSFETLRERLNARGTESLASIETRMGKAQQEISFAHHFTAIIKNIDLQQALEEARQVVGGFLNKFEL